MAKLGGGALVFKVKKNWLGGCHTFSERYDLRMFKFQNKISGFFRENKISHIFLSILLI